MFQFSGSPLIYLFIQYMMTEYCSVGFPHSDIHGSTVICTSPWLFAAYHVLLRLLMPRHSPCALLRLTSSSFPALASLLLVAKAVLCSGTTPLKSNASIWFGYDTYLAYRSELQSFRNCSTQIKTSFDLVAILAYCNVFCYTLLFCIGRFVLLSDFYVSKFVKILLNSYSQLPFAISCFALLLKKPFLIFVFR